MSDETNVRKIPFSYQKTDGYRTVTVSGAIGSSTPNGDIFMAVYTDRPHIPQASYISVDSDGKVLGKEELQISVGLVREVEVGLIMNIETAKKVREWLGQHIDGLEAMLKKTESLKQADRRK